MNNHPRPAMLGMLLRVSNPKSMIIQIKYKIQARILILLKYVSLDNTTSPMTINMMDVPINKYIFSKTSKK